LVEILLPTPRASWSASALARALRVLSHSHELKLRPVVFGTALAAVVCYGAAPTVS